MLEKMFGVRLVSKLQAIFLMEADFNATNKEVYGVRMLEEAQKYKLVPEDRGRIDKNLREIICPKIKFEVWKL
jgi:hypothetical protein